MPSDYRTAAALAVLGLLLVTNAVWLFPHEGETEYTNERVEIRVKDGTISYDGKHWGALDHANDIDEIGCQSADRRGRVCGFDAYLATEGSVTVTDGEQVRYRTAAYSVIESDYFRRIREPNGSTTSFDVERVSPEALLAEIATDAPGRPADEVWDGAPLQYRIAVTGETTTTHELLEDDALGTVYRQNGSYYTVVVTRSSTVDRGLPDSNTTRTLLRWVGLFVLLAALVRASEHTDWG